MDEVNSDIILLQSNHIETLAFHSYNPQSHYRGFLRDVMTDAAVDRIDSTALTLIPIYLPSLGPTLVLARLGLQQAPTWLCHWELPL